MASVRVCMRLLEGLGKFADCVADLASVRKTPIGFLFEVAYWLGKRTNMWFWCIVGDFIARSWEIGRRNSKPIPTSHATAFSK
jgi:hypothetical protein